MKIIRLTGVFIVYWSLGYLFLHTILRLEVENTLQYCSWKTDFAKERLTLAYDNASIWTIQCIGYFLLFFFLCLIDMLLKNIWK